MATHQLRRDLWVPQPLNQTFDFFSRAENLEQITPPWLRFRIVTPLPINMTAGATIEYALKVRGVPLHWLTEIQIWDPPYAFVDVQTKGPYKRWRHTHQFRPDSGGTAILDVVEYELPLGILGDVVHRVQVARDLEKIFDYRTQRVKDLLSGSGPAIE